MKLRRTMKAQSPKKKEKERNNKEKRKGSRSEDMLQGSRVRLEDMKQGSRSGQTICSKKNQHQGPMYIQIFSKKAIKNPAIN